MFDGSAGIYPGRAPLVGRLGVGELRLNDAEGKTESYFIEGGFIQIKGELVSVLTNAAVPTATISKATSAAELEEVKAEKASTAEGMETLSKKLDRARKLVSLASID